MTLPVDVTSLTGRAVVVTGASGFIGAHLCRAVHERGAIVHAISRALPSDAPDYIQWWRGDLRDSTVVRDVVNAVRPDVIFHLASHVAGSRDIGLILPTFHSNLTSTVNLLTTATELGCRRIILAGSLEEPVPNSDDAPSSPYAAAKWAARGYARMFHALYDTPAVIARIFMVYGPAQRDLQKLIPYVILSLLRGQSPRLSSGQRLVDWIYVDDVVQGLVAMATTSAPIAGSTVDLGSGTLVPIRTVVERLVAITDPGGLVTPRFGALPDRLLEQIRLADTAATASALGWQPVTSLETGLTLTVEWYKEQLAAGYI